MPRLSNYQHNVGIAPPLMRVDLHYKGGNSDKVYIIEITQNTTANTYTLMAYYGRNGANLQGTSYGDFHNFDLARSKLRQKQREKEQKGYTFIHEEAPNSVPMGVTKIQAAAHNVLLQFSLANKFVQSLKPVTFENVGEASFNRRYVTNDKFILHKIPNMRLLYAIDCQTKWVIVDAYDPSHFKQEWGTHLPSRDPDYVGLTWFGMMSNKGSEFIILDVAFHPHIADIHKKEWRARRAMMNIIYDQLYPGVDPYDTSNTFHFADYYYDDKIQQFMSSHGVWMARNIKHPLQAKFYVTTK